MVARGGGGGGCIPEGIFLGENKLEKKKKKTISDTPPENLEQTPPPKFGADTPPPPRKFGADTPPENFRHPPGTRPGTSPPRVDRHTPVNLLPWPNFVAAGNDHLCSHEDCCFYNLPDCL